MVVQLEKPIDLTKCSIESDGTVACKINKTKFNDIQRMNIKPRRVIFEIE